MVGSVGLPRRQSLNECRQRSMLGKGHPRLTFSLPQHPRWRSSMIASSTAALTIVMGKKRLSPHLRSEGPNPQHSSQACAANSRPRRLGHRRHRPYRLLRLRGQVPWDWCPNNRPVRRLAIYLLRSRLGIIGKRRSSIGNRLGSSGAIRPQAIGLRSSIRPQAHGVGSVEPRTQWLRSQKRHPQMSLHPRWRRKPATAALHAFMHMSAKRPTWTRWRGILGTKRQQFSLCVVATGRWRRK